jgi:VWFA-related protein
MDGVRLSSLVTIAICLSPMASTWRERATQLLSPGQSGERQTIRTATTLIEVDVIVEDRDGRFRPDLAISDFTLLEDGKLQTIEILYAVVGTHVRAMYPKERPADDRSLREFLPTRQMFVLFFDTENIGLGAAQRVRAAAESFLERHFRPGDIGGLVAWGRMANNRLTTDRAELLAAVRGMRGDADAQGRPNPEGAFTVPGGVDGETASGRGIAAEAARHQSETLRMGEAFINGTETTRTAVRTANALEGTVRGLVRFPGRKNLIVFSDGVPIEISRARRIVDDAVRASTRIYIVDTRGLNHSWANSALVTASEPTSLYVADPGTGGAPPWRPPLGKTDISTMLTSDTGGELVSNHNDFFKAVSIVAEDSTSYYVLGYASTNTRADGRLRKIDVRVGRSDLTVRARKGYLARSAKR